jgi:hypothetical protein
VWLKTAKSKVSPQNIDINKTCFVKMPVLSFHGENVENQVVKNGLKGESVYMAHALDLSLLKFRTTLQQYCPTANI